MDSLIGLVACGGKSTRMEQDKSLLNYQGVEQRYHCYNLLALVCKEVYLSCSKLQSESIVEKYQYISDAEEFSNIGPMAALLSAAKRNPNASFLLLGCDYPLIAAEDIQHLFVNRSMHHTASSIYNFETGLYEPLIALYEKKSIPLLYNSFQNKNYSLQHFLSETSAFKLAPKNPAHIVSVDTPEQAKKIKFTGKL
ncbi:MAG: NTP transferase domain-containing protein [Bacteroidetes bacterium]|nr:NTP transferase domain-containing protein [Bacteroidota bacterium]